MLNGELITPGRNMHVLLGSVDELRPTVLAKPARLIY